MKHSVYYLPAMRRSSAPGNVPAEVLFFADLLEKRLPGQNAPGAAEVDGAYAFPFSPAEGRVIVRDMLAMGGELGADLRGAFAVDARQQPVYKIDPAEEADLAAFAQSGEVPEKEPGNGPGTAPGKGHKGLDAEHLAVALQSAQKVLLLAGAREEAMHDALGLEEQLRGANDALVQSLGEGLEDDETLSGPLHWALAESSQPEAADWRTLVEAAFAFMPVSALALTTDEIMAAELAEQGLLGEVPASCRAAYAEFFSQGAHGAAWLELPGWRITGRTALPADKPWLARNRMLLVLAG